MTLNLTIRPEIIISTLVRLFSVFFFFQQTYYSNYHEFSSCILGDYLKVFMHLEGVSVNEYTPWETLLCGGFADIPAILYSSGSVLVLEFHSSPYTANSSGFLGTFRFLEKSK